MVRVRRDRGLGVAVVAALAVGIVAAPVEAGAPPASATMRAAPGCDPGNPENPAVRAAGADFGGVWASPPVDGVQRINFALVTGADEAPVREALRACGTDGITDIRPAAYPYSAVVAAQRRFLDRIGDLSGAGVVGVGIGVEQDRFGVRTTLLDVATPEQEAAVRSAATAVTDETGVPVTIDPQRSARPVPSTGELPPSAGTSPPGTSSPGTTPPPDGTSRAVAAPRPLTTRSSLRRAVRTGVVRVAIRRPVAGTTVILRTASGTRSVVGRGRTGAGKGTVVVRVALTTAGRARLARRATIALEVTTRAPAAAAVSRRLVLR